MIRPYVRRLHTIVAVLAIGNGVSRNTLHKSHLTHTAARIFDKEVCRIKLSDSRSIFLFTASQALAYSLLGAKLPASSLVRLCEVAAIEYCVQSGHAHI